MNASLRSGAVEGERPTFSAITTAPRMDRMTKDPMESKAFIQALYPALGITTPREESIRWINTTRLGDPDGCMVADPKAASWTGTTLPAGQDRAPPSSDVFL